MKLKPAEREAIRMMFGGKCAYCGVGLDGKWHVDHCEAVGRIYEYRNGTYEGGKYTPATMVKTNRMNHRVNDRKDNLFPACIRCNILKSDANIEGFRSILTYFAHSIPRIAGYSHVHHLMRFEKLHIDTTPVVFWFEKFNESRGMR